MPLRKGKTTDEEILRWASEQLHDAGVDIRESRNLLAYVIAKPKSYLVAHPENQLTEKQLKNFKALIQQRKRGIPFAYLTGHQGFYGLDFIISKAVLIPRPETEQLVDWVLGYVKKTKHLMIVDVGMGSGCIAVTLAKFLPNTKIIASDVSNAAIAIAKKNARMHAVSKRVAWRSGSLLTALKKNEQPDLVVANLPYLTKPQLKNVPYEPKLALHGGVRGLELIEKLIGQIVDRNIPQAILEIDPQQQRWLTGIGDRLTGYNYEFLPDLSGRTRFFVLESNHQKNKVAGTMSI